MHKGSCLCGKVQYEIDDELSDFGYCHCRSCRKASGSAHAANAGVSATRLRVLDPLNVLRKYESSPGKFRAFCGNCGSPIYTYLAKTPELVRVRLGTLDTPFTKHARAHTFVSDKAPWHVIHGDLPQFETWASRDVLIQAGSRQP